MVGNARQEELGGWNRLASIKEYIKAIFCQRCFVSAKLERLSGKLGYIIISIHIHSYVNIF